MCSVRLFCSLNYNRYCGYYFWEIFLLSFCFLFFVYSTLFSFLSVWRIKVEYMYFYPCYILLCLGLIIINELHRMFGFKHRLPHWPACKSKKLFINMNNKVNFFLLVYHNLFKFVLISRFHLAPTQSIDSANNDMCICMGSTFLLHNFDGRKAQSGMHTRKDL